MAYSRKSATHCVALLVFVYTTLCASVPTQETQQARIAFHLLWNSTDTASATSILLAIHDEGNTYLIDAIPPASASALSTAIRSAIPQKNIRIRSIDAPTPRGISEALALLDGMAELLWWGESDNTRTFDFYIPLYSGTERPLVRPPALRAILGAALRTGAPSPSFLRYSTPSEWARFASDYNTLYFDAAVVFSSNASARAALTGPHIGYPDRTRRAFARTEKSFVLSTALVTTAVDSVLSLRLLAKFAHSRDALYHFFGTLAIAAGPSVSTLVRSTSLRCPDVRGLDTGAPLSYYRPHFQRDVTMKERIPCVFLPPDASAKEAADADAMRKDTASVTRHEAHVMDIMREHISAHAHLGQAVEMPL